MPVVKIDMKVFSLLVAEARRLEISVKDLISMIAFEYFEIEGEEEAEAEEEVEAEEEEEEEEEE